MTETEKKNLDPHSEKKIFWGGGGGIQLLSENKAIRPSPVDGRPGLLKFPLTQGRPPPLALPGYVSGPDCAAS